MTAAPLALDELVDPHAVGLAAAAPQGGDQEVQDMVRRGVEHRAVDHRGQVLRHERVGDRALKRDVARQAKAARRPGPERRIQPAEQEQPRFLLLVPRLVLPGRAADRQPDRCVPHLPLEPRALTRSKRRILEVLGADAEDHVPAREGGETRMALKRLVDER